MQRWLIPFLGRRAFPLQLSLFEIEQFFSFSCRGTASDPDLPWRTQSLGLRIVGGFSQDDRLSIEFRARAASLGPEPSG